MEGKLTNLLTGLRKNHSTQHWLMCMLEMWKDTLDKGGYFCATFMNLCKAFDTLNHNLLIVKLEADGFKRESLSFMKSYLIDRQQRSQLQILVFRKRSLQEYPKAQYLDRFYLIILSMISLF